MRKNHYRWAGAGFLGAGLVLAACGDKAAAPKKTEPATVEKLQDGSKLSRLTLTGQAAQRIGIQTGTVEPGRNGTPLEVPFDAVIYQSDGTTWVYTNPDGLAYVRAPIEVERIQGDRALLKSGPVAGTRVVTLGAPELLGLETGIGK